MAIFNSYVSLPEGMGGNGPKTLQMVRKFQGQPTRPVEGVTPRCQIILCDVLAV